MNSDPTDRRDISAAANGSRSQFGHLGALIAEGIALDPARLLVTDGVDRIGAKAPLARPQSRGVADADRAPSALSEATAVLERLLWGPPVRWEATGSERVDTVLELRTSGTSGEPKVVGFTELEMVASYVLLSNYQATLYFGEADGSGLINWASIEELTRRARSFPATGIRMASLAPPSTVAGVAALIRCTLGGGSAIFIDPAAPTDEVISQLRAFEPATLTCPPLWAERLARFGVPVQSLFHIGVGGGHARPATLRTLEERMQCVVTVGYGLTEAGGVLSMSSLGDAERLRHASVGVAVPGVDLRVAAANDATELCFRSPAMAAVVRESSQRTRIVDRDDWLSSGDEASIDDDGVVSILGRTDEVIIRGGRRISPFPIEAALEQHPLVERAAVVGVRNTRLGTDDIVAAVSTSEPLDPRTLMSWCVDNMESATTPKRLVALDLDHFVTAAGKLSRVRLRRALEST